MTSKTACVFLFHRGKILLIEGSFYLDDVAYSHERDLAIDAMNTIAISRGEPPHYNPDNFQIVSIDDAELAEMYGEDVLSEPTGNPRELQLVHAKFRQNAQDIESLTPFYISNADFYIVLNHIKKLK